MKKGLDAKFDEGEIPLEEKGIKACLDCLD